MLRIRTCVPLLLAASTLPLLGQQDEDAPRPHSHFLLEVVSEETGEPVEEFELWAAPQPPETKHRPDGSSTTSTFFLNGPSRWPVAKNDEGAWVARRPGLNGAQFLVRPLAPDLGWAHHYMESSLRGPPVERMETIVIRVPTLQERTVTVTGADGAPVAGAVIDLLMPIYPAGRYEEPPAGGLRPLVEELEHWHSTGDLGRFGIVRSATTDAAGRAVLRGAPGVVHGVRVVAENFQQLHRGDLVFQGEEDALELALSPAGILIVDFEPSLEELASAHPHLRTGERLRYRQHFEFHLRGEGWTSHEADLARHTADGKIVYPHAPLGFHTLICGSWQSMHSQPGLEGEGVRSTIVASSVLGLEFVAGDATEITIDLRESLAMPVTMALRGSSGVLASVRVSLEGPLGRGRQGPCTLVAPTSEEGRIHAHLLPGSYRVARIRYTDAEGRVRLKKGLRKEFTVEPMKPLEVALHFEDLEGF